MVGYLFQNYDTIYVRFFPRILAVIPATRYTSFFLPRILAFFPALWGFYSQVYDQFLTNAHIYAHKKAIYMPYKQACGIWGHRKSSYKRHRINCHAINYYVLFAFSCDLDDLSCHCRASNQSNENTRLYGCTS